MLKLSRIRILWVLTALFTLIAALVGVINPGIYHNLIDQKYIPGTISQDYIALLASILLLFCVFWMNEKTVVKQIVGLGILGFLFYAYGIYVIEQVYNALYLIYMAIFSLSFFSIVYSVANIRKDILENIRVSDTVRKISAGFSFLIPLVFSPLWIMMLLPLLQTGERIENIFSVFILDLCFIMPVFVILAVMTVKKKGLGIFLTPAMFVLGFTLLFPVGFAEVIKVLYGMNASMDMGSMFMYLGIAIVFLVLNFFYLKNLKRSLND